MADSVSTEIRKDILSKIHEGYYAADKPLPTVRDFSELYNVSTKTVSKAMQELRGEGIIDAKVGKGTYIKSMFSHSRKSKKIGLLCSYGPKSFENSKSYPGNVILPFKNRIEKAGFSLSMCQLHSKEIPEIIKALKFLKPAVMVLFEVADPRIIMAIRELCIPMVSIDFDTCYLGVSCVVFDNIWSGFQATRHVIKQGHEHIVCLYPRYFRQIGNNPFSDPVEENRIHGYRLAMQEAELPAYIEEYPPGKDSTKNKIIELFSRRPSPTALVCKRDEEALTAAQELVERGFRIPEDISIVTLAGNGTEYVQGRKFTYMKYKYKDMGETAAGLVLDTVKDPEKQILSRSIIGVELVEEKSVLRIGS